MKKKDKIAVRKKTVPQMLKSVDSKISELKDIAPMETFTDGHGFSAVKEYGLIASAETETFLIKCYASILVEEKMYKSAFKEMGVKGKMPELKMFGHTPKEWKNDIIARYEFLSIDKQLDKLTEAKYELEKNLSKSDKLKNSLDKIQNILTE